MTTKRSDRTFELLGRLWREHLIHHKARLTLVLALTLLMAGTTALYPVVINHAFDMFTDHDRRILYQIPALVVAVTGVKALAQYFQNVQVQQVVLLVIRELQGRMFAHLTRADLARLEREAPGPARRPLHHRRRHDPRGADPRGQRRRRRRHGDRPGRQHDLPQLAAVADRGGAVSDRGRADRADRQARPQSLRRHAGTRRRNRRAAERKLRPGPHRPRLPPGGQRNPPRRGRFRNSSTNRCCG